MRELLIKSGFRETERPASAGYVIVNSCTVTRHSDRKTMYYLRRFKKANPEAKIIVAGCITEDENNLPLLSRSADIIISNREKADIVRKITKGLDKTGMVSDSQTVEGEAEDNFSISSFKGHSRAFIKVQDGCNMNCSYCKVRIVRGKSRSRPIEDICKEIEDLVSNGYKEIVLTGIQLGAYGRDLTGKSEIVLLLEKISEISGLTRMRLSSIEPFDVSDELIEYMAGNYKICPHLHIPLQSGDDSILKSMRRGYTSNQFKELISRIKGKIPCFGLTTDVIVGFPGEDEDAFLNTINVLRETKPHKIHFFPFSPRPGTDASLFSGRVSHQEIKRRENILKSLNKELFLSSSQFLRETVQPVLLETYAAYNSTIIGRLPDYRKVFIEADSSLINSIVQVLIVGCGDEYLRGRLAHQFDKNVLSA